MSIHTVKATVLAGAFCMIAALHPAVANTFQVSPVRVDLSAQLSTAALTVSNNGTEPVVIQLQSMVWSQENGNDQYGSTGDLIATPPIFTIPPGASQIVRVGMRRRPDTDRELSYRVYMQEVPPAPRAGFQGLQMALRIGIPVFLEPLNKTKPVLQFGVTRLAQDKLAVVLSNQGKVHLQVTDFKVTEPGQEQPLAVQQVSSYLLPMQQRSYTLTMDRNKSIKGRSMHVTAFTDAGNMEADVLVDQP